MCLHLYGHKYKVYVYKRCKMIFKLSLAGCSAILTHLAHGA